MPNACLIPGNPDVAGIGVCVGVYMQAALAILGSALELIRRVDSEVRPKPSTTQPKTRNCLKRGLTKAVLTIIKDTEKDLPQTIYLSGWTIIISALSTTFSQNTLTDYHALVVLNLSLVNYFSAFMLLVRQMIDFTYPKHKSGKELGTGFKWICLSVLGYPWMYIPLKHPRFVAVKLVPFNVHAILLSAFGLIFWTRRELFLSYTESSDCTHVAFYWAFYPISLSNTTLKTASIVFYSLLLIPLLNAVVTVVLFHIPLFLFLAVPSVALIILLLAMTMIALVVMILVLLITILFPSTWGPVTTFIDSLPKLREELFSPAVAKYGALPVLLTVPIYSIIAAEMFIRSNAGHIEPNVEDKWTYGQIPALSVAFLPFLVYIRGIVKKEESSNPETLLQTANEGSSAYTGHGTPWHAT